MNIKKITLNGVAVLLLSLSSTFLSAQNFAGPVTSFFNNIGNSSFTQIRHTGSVGILNARANNFSSRLDLQVNNTTRMTFRINGNAGIGTLSPIAKLDVRGDNFFLSPSLSGNPTGGKFIGLGESGGECDLYGFRSQLDQNNSINVGIRPNKVPTVTWGNDGSNLEFRYGMNENCGFLNVIMGPKATGLGAGMFVNDILGVKKRIGIGTDTPSVPLDVRGSNILLSPNGSATGKFVGLGESGGVCDLYGYRAQLDVENSVNLGVRPTKVPTLLWGNSDVNLEIRTGTGSSFCGNLIASFGTSLVNSSQGAAINGGLFVRSRVGVRTNNPIAQMDVRGDNIFLSPSFSSNPTGGKFVSLGESGGVCDLYGYRAQLDLTNSVNLGMEAGPNDQVNPSAILQWGNANARLELRTGLGQTNCGNLIASFGTGLLGGEPGMLVDGGIAVDQPVLMSLPANGNIVEPIEGAMDKIMAIEGLNYEYVTAVDEERDSRSTTFVLDAEELGKVMPELVTELEDRKVAINYMGMIPVFVEAFQQQQEVIETQNVTIEQQKEELAEMETRLARIEALLSSGNVNTNSLSTQPAATISTSFDDVKLSPNRPNPFNNVTAIDYTLPASMTNANLVVFDITGEKLASYELAAGEGTVEFSATGIGNGTYVYVIFADGQIVAQQKMTIQK